jgi:hypothetical protein
MEDISGLKEALFTAIVKYRDKEMPLVYDEVCDTKWIKDIVHQLVTIEFRYIEHLMRNMEAAGVECKGPWPSYRIAIALVSWCLTKKPYEAYCKEEKPLVSWLYAMLGIF